MGYFGKKIMAMALRSALMVFILSFGLHTAFAQSTPEQISAKFFEMYKTQGGSDAAIDYLFGTNKYTESLHVQLDTLKSRLKTQISYYGEYYGYDLLAKKSAGPNYIMLVYLVRHDREPLTFRMLFYKPADKWKIQNFTFNEDMDDELKDEMKKELPADVPSIFISSVAQKNITELKDLLWAEINKQ